MTPRPLLSLLDNIVWHALSGPQSGVSAGTDRARRYARGFSPIVGFSDQERPDFAALAGYCEAGEHFYCDGWNGAAPDGWTVDSEMTMFKMAWDGGAPPRDDIPEAVRLGPEHAAQALELATLTRPGPFGPRTIELGDYVGCFDGARLIAMAGERMHAGTLRELSGVCTHPDHQGRGYARRLMLRLMARQRQRGETPFLHVMRANDGAKRLYERMGFRVVCEAVVRVVTFGGGSR
ncbi:MAG: GNAT family N-acetyltransferase [Betaproteobacteria bacterium]